MAPSSTRMRWRSKSRNADRVPWDALTISDSGSADRLHHWPQAQQVADREHEIGAIHRVEMECGDPAVDEVEHLLGRDRRGNQFACRRIIIEALETLRDPRRNRSPAALGKAGRRLEVLHRQDARHDRDVDAARPYAVEIAEIEVVLEEELGDGAGRA